MVDLPTDDSLNLDKPRTPHRGKNAVGGGRSICCPEVLTEHFRTLKLRIFKMFRKGDTGIFEIPGNIGTSQTPLFSDRNRG